MCVTQYQAFFVHTIKILSLDFDCILSDMRCFLDDKCNEKIPPSQIHCMELINENPDSDETMCIIAEDLLEKFDTKEQDGWVVIVGDGKMYQHLLNIKQQYGTALEKLKHIPWRLAYTKELPANSYEGLLSCWSKGTSQSLWISECYSKITRSLQ